MVAAAAVVTDVVVETSRVVGYIDVSGCKAVVVGFSRPCVCVVVPVVSDVVVSSLSAAV